MTKKEAKARVKDQAGWSLGMRAALRGLFGTNTELHYRSGGVDEVMRNAGEEVANMSEAAKGLLETLGETSEPKERMDEVFEQIVRDL